ncbi:Calx-beta domain-containing protein [Maribacter sp. 4G9]|uniref:Calx-beta domain-containing protein n=1 Tax=Maribacter sp. 4G9 TaxID=1889777 RepID=UPI000C374720|nr:Calx-beta domain-containing protein [Maribacter sp. 4G9]PIB29901.1 hypothetical protein BFP75_03415 [Maribacter sp. 4G9]
MSETAGTVDISVTHSSGTVGGGFTVDFQTINGTAVSGSDYTSTSGTINFSGTPGDTETVTVPILDDSSVEGPENFILDLVGSSNPSVDITDTGVITIDDDEVPVNAPLVLVQEFNGNFDFTSTGGSLRTLPNSTSSPNDACQIQTSSQAPLLVDIPVGANIEKAYLYWAHSNITLDMNVTFEGQNVTADQAYSSFITTRQFNGYVSDVTSIVRAKANLNTADFTFTDLDVDNSANYCGSSTVLGGWALMVFYEESSLPVSAINVYQGFYGISDDTNSYTLDSFYAISGAGSKASFLSWEGDENIVGAGTGSVVENLSISVPGDPAVNLTGDGGQTGNNPYNSTIYDNTTPTTINITTSYGLDWDTYDLTSILDPGDTQFTANVAMGQDFVISNAVVLKVQSNLIAGTVFEDVNYGGGSSRNMATASGVPVVGATVEIFDNFGNLWNSTTTDSNGDYSFGGMADGTYNIRVVNSTVRSSRGGGSACSTCLPIQTYRTSHNGTSYNYITSEIGGALPSQQDVGAGIFSGAQTTSSVTIAGGGLGNIDFGFNFNTIVNTNEDGQGSLEQFIVNSNNLDETGLDIEANALFDPASGEDTSVFMIPSSGDSLGRSADSNYSGGYFDIFISNVNPLSNITSDNTKIDGRTQTAYSGNTNTGSIGAGGSSVGTSAIVLPNYDLPEIQVHRNGGDVFKINANNTQIRNLSIYANNNAGIRIDGGSIDVQNNLLGVNATGVNAGDIDIAVENLGGNVLVDSNYIATNTDTGILVNGGTSNIIQNNHITSNGDAACDDNIMINGGSGIVIQQNLIENAASLGIDAASSSGNLIISENTITGSGQDGGNCGTGAEDMGIELAGSNSQITNNVIHNNGSAGIALVGSGIGNLISQNSFYANGTNAPALGIDILGDGVTLNDLNDADGGPNGSLNFPIISGVYGSSTSITIEGWSRPGATLEFFMTDINEGTANAGDNQLGLLRDYGEGQVYVATMVEGGGSDLDSKVLPYTDTDGNTDNTNKFKFSIALPPGVNIGELITATATISNSTSEFSPLSEIRANSLITNKRITYRIKKN